MKSLNVLKCLIPFCAAVSLAAQQTPQPPAQQPPKPPVTQPGTPAPVKPPGAEASSPGTSGPMVIVSPDTVVLIVGGEKMTRAQFEELLAALPDQGRATPAGPGPCRRPLDGHLAQISSL